VHSDGLFFFFEKSDGLIENNEKALNVDEGGPRVIKTVN
jgi:hypothetical protein